MRRRSIKFNTWENISLIILMTNTMPSFAFALADSIQSLLLSLDDSGRSSQPDLYVIHCEQTTPEVEVLDSSELQFYR